MEEILSFFNSVYSKHPRYWYPELSDSERYSLLRKHAENWQTLFNDIRKSKPGKALDLGAGEGTDAIKLAMMGFEVDAVEGSVVGSEKIENIAKRAGVRINVINQNIEDFESPNTYDVVICNGVLHYVQDKLSVLHKIDRLTSNEGFTLISLFSDATPTPDCHRIVDVFPDSSNGIVRNFFSRNWTSKYSSDEHNRLDLSHPGFPPHSHSFVKLVMQKRGNKN